MVVLRVRHDTPAGKLAQSLARALAENPVVEMTAVGVPAIHIATLAQGAVQDMIPAPWIQTHLMVAKYENNEREGRRWVIARDLESAQDYALQLRQAAE